MRTRGRDGPGVLGRAIRGQWRLVAAGSVLAAGHQAGEALVPVLVGVIIDRAVGPGDGGELLRWCLVLAGVHTALSLCFRYGIRFGERSAELAGHAVRMELTARVLHPRGGAGTGRLPGELTNVATSDAQRVGRVTMAVSAALAALTGLVVSAVALLRVSLPLGLLVLVGVPVLLGLTHLLGRPLQRRSAAEQERAAHASGVAADLVAGLRVLKGVGAEPAAVARYRHTSRGALTATVRAARAEAWHDGAVLAMTGLVIALVALAGGRLAARGQISVGELVAAVGLAQFLLGPLQVLAWANAELAQGRASAARVASVLTAPWGVGSGGLAPAGPVPGRVRFRAVHHDALHGVDFEAAPGELLGVVATDQAATGDLLRCLTRDTDPRAGTVELDGVPLTSLDPAWLHGAVLVAAHDADLFEGTVRENIAGTADPGRGLDAVLAASGADEVCRSLPDGAATHLTERGRSLSGGQRQRVALARALAADPPVLVLHDPTTAVDPVTEARVAHGLRAFRAGRTTILLTGSPTLLAVTDRVVLLDRGTVTDQAPHAELVTRRHDYRTAVLA
ncbi:multidrug ABC transporter ATP-binding protein [Wenjunlia vitaminophila]|uniref:Multidrug ABC transporter ATP-binding protein n=1 Tax=Wenjunlia vitaminophila TaxID=76728 RepID=A0A0T6LXI4_WENVI|nr:ABC transporter ATP-binding protein [Wenjunlia vitaminophila]KRV50460.1 multidrug ABC transporter ATP-binding protein [Wenjunlia vitaminophila]